MGCDCFRGRMGGDGRFAETGYEVVYRRMRIVCCREPLTSGQDRVEVLRSSRYKQGNLGWGGVGQVCGVLRRTVRA